MCGDAGFGAIKVEAVGRTVTLDRLSFYLAKFLRSKGATMFRRPLFFALLAVVLAVGCLLWMRAL